MSAKGLIIGATCIVLLSPLSLAEGVRPIDIQAALKEAFYLQLWVAPLEREIPHLFEPPSAEQVQRAVEAFDKSRMTYETYVKEKKIYSVTFNYGDLLKDVSSDLPTAVAALREAYEKVLTVGYNAMAQKQQFVAENGDEYTASTAWRELAAVRAKQLDYVGAKTALWKGYTERLTDPGMSESLRVFHILAEYIGAGLIDTGAIDVAKEHFTALANTHQAQLSGQGHVAYALVCYMTDDPCGEAQLAETKAAPFADVKAAMVARISALLQRLPTTPELYPGIFRANEGWRKAYPQDLDVLNLVVGTVAAQNSAERFQEWFAITSDCETRVAAVEMLQRLAKEPQLQQAEATLAACGDQNERARDVFAVANAREATRLWNAEIVERPPQDAETARARLKQIRAHLDKAAGVPNLDEFAEKVDKYEKQWSDTTRVSQENTVQLCQSLHNRLEWLAGNPGAEIIDRLDILRDLRANEAKCRAQLGADVARTPQICKEGVHRASHPVDVMQMSPEQKSTLRKATEEFLRTCRPHLSAGEQSGITNAIGRIH
ncbi:MAG: hypothetical protein KBD01_05065 [Acidobacteria bacterium]|nr:hypothetical protein [Acidobacteriota bacterium]